MKIQQPKAPKPPKLLTTAEAIDKLRLFNSKIELVRRGRFFQQVLTQDHSVTISFGESQPLSVEKSGPDEDATLAFAITLRFFMQERDGISLKQISDLYSNLAVSAMCKQSAHDVYHETEAYLDSGSSVIAFGETITKRRLLHAFMYGDIAHVNKDQKADYDAWIDTQNKKTLEFLFEEIAVFLIECIQSFHAMNARTIHFLETGIPSPDQLETP